MSVFELTSSRLKIMTLLVLLGLVLLWSLGILPMRRKIGHMAGARTSIQSRLSKLQELDNLYGAAFAGLNVFPSKEGENVSNISLMSYLEALAHKEGLGEMITYMKPHEERNMGTLVQYLVEMRFDSITAAEMTTFLYALEVKDGRFGIARCTLEPDRQDGETFDLTLLLSRNVSF